MYGLGQSLCGIPVVATCGVPGWEGVRPVTGLGGRFTGVGEVRDSRNSSHSDSSDSDSSHSDRSDSYDSNVFFSVFFFF